MDPEQRFIIDALTQVFVIDVNIFITMPLLLLMLMLPLQCTTGSSCHFNYTSLHMWAYFTVGLRLVEVRIPNYVIKGSAAQLECMYELDGEALYSVKWYKDGNEFYRYVPRDMPPAQTFLLPGVNVDLHNSSDATVTLRNVNLQSAGRFRCEVSGEAPSFQTVTEHGDMVVVSLPDQGPPKITGGRPRYQIGDVVRINCTAGRSKPAVNLSWFVNGDAAEPQKLRKYETIVSGREGLETSVLGLQFRVEQHHFRNGDMKLKCVASLSTFYWRSNEESVEGDRPQKAPVLESRETVYASNSRADPVQASKTDSLLVARAPNALLLLALATGATLAGIFRGGGWPTARHNNKGRPRVGVDDNDVIEKDVKIDGDGSDELVALATEIENKLLKASVSTSQLVVSQHQPKLLTAR
ncbi:uncharacterized protein Dwil_GK23873 [Drosophila willistoni]|uniref:Ig-like domain-containing protein n=1 Tax=Drosophila willistoni TaxID=7260 RepID=B4MTM9_DROWI|nr:uncharacterized protein Dwil_GK23873 [Drosophila willistoni]